MTSDRAGGEAANSQDDPPRAAALIGDWLDDPERTAASGRVALRRLTQRF